MSSKVFGERNNIVPLSSRDAASVKLFSQGNLMVKVRQGSLSRNSVFSALQASGETSARRQSGIKRKNYNVSERIDPVPRGSFGEDGLLEDKEQPAFDTCS